MKDEGTPNESRAYVLDTSAILTLLEAEDGADIVRRFIRQAIEQEINLYASVVSLMEVCYISLNEKGKKIEDLNESEFQGMLSYMASEEFDNMTVSEFFDVLAEMEDEETVEVVELTAAVHEVTALFILRKGNLS